MKKTIFQILSFIVKALPSYAHRDLEKLKKWEMALVGFKIWVTYNLLDSK